MNELEKAQLKIERFCEWLQKNTGNHVCFEVEHWSFKPTSWKVMLWSQKHGKHIYFNSLKDFFKTVDIFIGNIDLFFSDHHCETYKDYKNLMFQNLPFFKRALECFKMSIDDYKTSDSTLKHSIYQLALRLEENEY
jgi:hypothetical protein